MSFGQIIKRYWITLLAVMGLFFCVGVFATRTISSINDEYYSIKVNSDVISKEDIDVDFFLDALRKSDGKYSYSTVKPTLFFENNDIKIKENSDGVTIKIKKIYFYGSDDSKPSDETHERFIKVMNKVVTYHDKDATIKDVDYGKSLYANGLIMSLFGLIIFAVVMLLLRKKLKLPNDDIYKSQKIFRFPFSRLYWKNAFDEVRNLKIFDLCLISILFSLQIVMKFISIPSGFASLGIGLTYLIFVYISLIYGPIWGIIIGFGSDIIGFLIHPTRFHPGYTLQAMITGFVYGLCFYKTDLRFSKTLTARIIVNIFLNGIMGSFLWGDYTGLSSNGISGVYLYMVTIALPKNIVYLFPQVILLYFFLKATVPLLIRKKLVSKEVLPRKQI